MIQQCSVFFNEINDSLAITQMIYSSQIPLGPVWNPLAPPPPPGSLRSKSGSATSFCSQTKGPCYLQMSVSRLPRRLRLSDNHFQKIM